MGKVSNLWEVIGVQSGVLTISLPRQGELLTSPATVTGTGSALLPYTSSFQGGAQEGIVAVYMYSRANGLIATTAIVKVMIGG